MEALINRQKSVAEMIQKMIINFGKDSASRKTEENIQKRLKELDDLWTELVGNHMKLATEGVNPKEFNYLDLYNKAKEHYDNFRRTLLTFNPTNPTEDKATTSKADELKGQQGTNFRALMRVINGINIDNLQEKWELEDKLQMLQQRWKTIDDLHWKIDNLLMGTDISYEQDYTAHEDTYESTKKALNKKLSSTAHQQQSTPKVDIPTFSGNYTQWPTFLDLYTEAIHNNPTLSKVQKMQHLKGKLKGEAERLVQHLYITADNYDTCWELLSYRYNNVQLLFTKHVQLLMNQQSVHKQTSYELKRLYDTSMEAVHAIQNLGIDTATWDPILVHIICEKLDGDTYSSYMEARKTPRDLPTFDELMTFIEGKFTALEPMNNKIKKSAAQITPTTPKPFGSKQESTYKPALNSNFKDKNHYNSYPVADNRHCPLCKTDHILFHCKTFQGMTPDTKLKTIEQLHICSNCLYCHNSKPCTSRKRCKVCNNQHNTILHDLFQHDTKPAALARQNTARPTTSTSSSHHVSNPDNEVLLSTVLLKIKSRDGTYTLMRALIDQGSQVNLISENAAQRLGLPRHHHSGTVSGIGSSFNRSKGLVELSCESLYNDYKFTTEAIVMTSMLNDLPNNTFQRQHWEHLQGIQLADPDYNISRPVDILLDASVYSDIIMDGILRGPIQAPLAQKTKIGWILFGNIKTFNCHVTINNIEEFSRFWEMEEIMNDSTTLTAEEEYCESLYKNTTTRLQDGRYQVRIPMKQDYEQHLGTSKSPAVAQFLQLEKRMLRDQAFGSQYSNFIYEYLTLGHMKLSNQNKKPSYYLPHHGVMRLDSTTTKLRVVFNGSCKTHSGHSLNELMLCGPNLQQDLQAMIMRWRKYKFVYTADIEKFYRQIMIHEDDQPLQKIIWRNSTNEPLQDYQLTTVTYGTKAAPFLSMRTIKQLVMDDGHKYPLACDTLNNQLYVDDLLGGQDDIHEAKKTQQQLIQILEGGGFNLRKWASNDPRLLENLSEPQISVSMLDFKHTQSNKTLGLRWNPQTDHFTFQRKAYQGGEDNISDITKRSLLSDMSTLYDPLGWLSPVTIKAKLIFQGVWESGVNWDDSLPEKLQTEWLLFRNDLPNIEKIVIPRWIGNTTKQTELHGFSDASEKAYSCVIYCKTTTETGEVDIRLITAKTKLAPLKKAITIPRLELCGALLLSRLMKKVIEAINRQDITIHGWTDSMIVLGWLQRDATQWKTFVANRVTEITNVMPTPCWKHVASEQNPADCASRGLNPTQLLDHKLWWSAPTWLRENAFPQQQTVEVPKLEAKTQHTSVTCVTTKVEQESNLLQKLIQKYSSITQLIRVTCWISRFIHNTRPKNKSMRNKKNYLTANELQQAHTAIMKAVQLDFIEDIMRLRKHGAVNNKSNLLKLNPVLDANSLLRVGGRLTKSNLQETSKHPIILPKNHRVTELLINQAHEMTLHAGAKLTLGHLRNKYWILGGYGRVKNQLQRCVKCIRFKSNNNNQLMADLPAPRVVPSRPFTHCGVDFTGQVEVKANKGRGIKTTAGYIAVFVCLSTKAIHLELVSDLSANTFIAAFKRMCARRGAPKHMYSDNGLNFVGSAKILAKENKEALEHYINTEFMEHIAAAGVEWHFNAPAWPSAGGLWEAAVRTMKHHLKRVIGDQKLTFEEFTTLLTSIEACLNSRPLTILKEDSEDLDYLTPGHFLVGGPILSTQSGTEVTDIRTRWQLIEKMHRDFWKQWSSEYLQTLQTRNKWNTKKKNIEVGDIVVIKENNAPPAKWLLGKVQQLHHGTDGLVRVVTLKTKNGTTKRPIVKLVPLHVTANPTTTHDAQQATHQKKNTKQSIKGTSLIHSLLTTLLVMATLISTSTQQLYNITTLDAGKPVYFDKITNIHIIQDEWKIIVYYNLTTYRQSLNNIENYVTHLSDKCTSDTAFLTIAYQLQHEIKELKHNDHLLQSEHGTRMKKRGLVNGVGYLANSLFGVLDERFAEKYKRDIRQLQNNENHLKKLYQEQTSIIEGEYNLLKRNEQVMNKQYLLINDHLRKLQNEEAKLEINQQNAIYLTSGTLAATAIVSNLHRIQDSLIDMITDLRNGRVDIHLLKPEELLKQLRIIASQLPSDMSLPNFSSDQNIRNIYKTLRVHSRISEEFLVFEVKLPLLNIDRYELHRIIPVPQKRSFDSVSIIPTSDYVAINLQKDMFITMYPEQLNTCIAVDEEHSLCPLRQPIYNLKGTETTCEAQIINNENITRCKLEISTCSDKWIQLHQGGAWLYSCCQECTVRIFCTAGVTSERLQATGLIALGQGCLLKHDTFTIPAHLSLQSTLMKSDNNQMKIAIPQLPEINKFIYNGSITRFIEPENHGEILKQLKQKIDIVKKQQEDIANDEIISSHDIHQYTLIYIFTSMAMIYLAYKGIRKFRGKCFRPVQALTPSNSQMTSHNCDLHIAVESPSEAPSANLTLRKTTVDATTSPTMPRETRGF